jgi:orotidine-5'-phosphate decarboxylase
MGEDSIKPFLEFKDKWTIVLGLTSNPGAADFELQQIAGAPLSGITFEKPSHDLSSAESKCLYHHVLQTVSGWGSEENLMFVIGATNTDQFNGIRHLTPNHFYLVPGVGAQGGSLQQVSKMAMIRDCGLLVNASRAIIYASTEKTLLKRLPQLRPLCCRDEGLPSYIRLLISLYVNFNGDAAIKKRGKKL